MYTCIYLSLWCSQFHFSECSCTFHMLDLLGSQPIMYIVSIYIKYIYIIRATGPMHSRRPPSKATFHFLLDFIIIVIQLPQLLETLLRGGSVCLRQGGSFVRVVLERSLSVVFLDSSCAFPPGDAEFAFDCQRAAEGGRGRGGGCRRDVGIICVQAGRQAGRECECINASFLCARERIRVALQRRTRKR